ncbi:MAG: hypothetical protein WCA10_02045 [Terracidiphilus sp.]
MEGQNRSLVIIDGKARRSTSGTFYLDWRENGQRRTRSVGTSPREALDAWQLQSGIFAGEISERRIMGVITAVFA